MKNIIAIDGPAGAGKGTLTVKLGDYLGFATLDTGSLYRAVTVYLIDTFGEEMDHLPDEKVIDAAKFLSESGELFKYSKDCRIRDKLTNIYVPKFAAIHGVREYTKVYQRSFALNPPKLDNGKCSKGAVVEGRDIGTVICPDAPVKLFLMADVKERAKRRWLEYKEAGKKMDFEEVLQHIKDRDASDMNRKESPLKPAEDALIINTTEMTIEEVFKDTLKYIDSKLKL